MVANFIEIALRHGCSPVNLLHIFRTPFPRNTSGSMLLQTDVLDYHSKYLKLLKVTLIVFYFSLFGRITYIGNEIYK